MRPLILLAAVLSLVWLPAEASSVQPEDPLDRGFLDPPDSAKPHAWWHWMNGNVTGEGITADLEAMKRVGLGGAQIFHVAEGIPEGNVRFLGPEWSAMMGHAFREAARLGLELCVHNCAGWSSSGGPWVKPEQAMMAVVTSERPVQGPGQFHDVLPLPPSRLGFYRDIAVLAFPTPAGETIRMADAAPRVTASASGLEVARLVDGRRGTVVALPAPRAGQPQHVQLEFARPFLARRLQLVPGPGTGDFGGTIQVSDDGQTFRNLREFQVARGEQPSAGWVFDFEPVAARIYRILFTRASRRATVGLVEIELSAAYRINDLEAQTFAVSGDVHRLTVAGRFDAALAVAPHQVVDLATRLDASGRLSWDVPEGQWTILRLGYTPNGRHNHPAPREGTGLEVDKLSREAMDAYFEEGMMRKVLRLAGPLVGKSFNNALIDSYEVGSQNWTPRFSAEFRKRRGYDLLPWLPTFSGRAVDSPELTERFLWDLRRTIADLFAENYARRFAELCHQNGLLCSIEPYGNGPFNDLDYGAAADILMGEFWTGGGVDGSVKLAAALAHTNGRRYVGAESFTASPENGKWLNTPWSLKAIGDQAFCAGVNRLIFHRYAMQPWKDVVPGMTMGQWGFHFDRTNTWWEQAPAWTRYLARCQFLLQQGHYAADAVYYCGEDAPGSLRAGSPPLPKGYEYDGCGTNVLVSRMHGEDSRIVLPDGMTYRVLVLPADEAMSPALLRTIKGLVAAGATVVGPKPRRAPGLQGYPDCDAQVRTLADEIWGDCDGRTVTEHRLGRGRVVWGRSLEQVFAELSLPPDVDASDPKLRWIHRVVGSTDIYFVSNQGPSVFESDVWFRIAGKRPELWDAEQGRIADLPVYKRKDGRTRVALRLDPSASLFVVFRRPAPADSIVAIERRGPLVAAGKRPATLVIDNAVYGALVHEGEGWVDVTSKVKALAARGTRRIPATNDMAGTDPANMIIKELSVDLIVAGARKRLTAPENDTLELPPGAEVVRALYGDIPPDTELKDRIVDITGKLASLVKDGTLSVVATNELAGRDPAYLTVKKLRVEYTLNGAHRSVTVGENQPITLPVEEASVATLPTHALTATAEGPQLEAWAEGAFTFRTASGRVTRLNVPAPPPPLELKGPWTLHFPSGRGAPEAIRLEALGSWTEHPEPGVKYFSGSATYSRSIEIPADRVGAGRALYLDLGRVNDFAEPVLNGKPLGVLWKPPFRVELTGTARPGQNELSVRVTNRWPNRLIGDEQLPEDVEWAGIHLAAWPRWLLEGTPRRSGRITFTTWHHWKKDDPLLESGLLGPVQLVSSLRAAVKPGP